MAFVTSSISAPVRSHNAEIALTDEIRCAKNDLAQAETRMRFVIATMHYLKNTDLKDK